ncbi:MAG: hypothetical protein AAB568_03965, partial [Patescibacteria group bacterium]
HPFGRLRAGSEQSGAASKDLLCFEKDFFRLVKLGFSHRRKMLRVNLKSRVEAAKLAQILLSLGLPATTRAQELTVDNWQKLFNLLK